MALNLILMASSTRANFPSPKSFSPRQLKHITSLNLPRRCSTTLSLPLSITLVSTIKFYRVNVSVNPFFRPSVLRIRSSFAREDSGNLEPENDSLDGQNEIFRSQNNNSNNNGSVSSGNSLLILLGVAVGIAAIITITSIGLKRPIGGGGDGGVSSFFGVQCLAESSASSASGPVGFSFKAFGYRIILPEYAPGWIYFWLLMAAGCGLFVSEEALNVWVGISLSRMLSLDGTWQSFVESFSRNAPYIMSTVLWVYWGVCISDMIPFYLGKLFRESGTTDDICLKLGIGEEKALSISNTVQKYGNLAGLVERFSLGVRNPTGFLAGMMGVSPEIFFAGVCGGCLITLPLQGLDIY